MDITKERLLRVAGELLSLADQTPSTGASNTSSGTTTTTTAPSTASSVRATMSVASTGLQEHRRVFNYAKGRSNYSGKGKGPAKKKTCTLKFYCLGGPNEEHPPGNVGQKTALANVGLGAHPLTLDVDNSCVHNVLMSTFPLLVSAGGYELLMYQRQMPGQGFHKLDTPHSTERLKALANQATIYIRPLQVDLLELAYTKNATNGTIHQPSPEVKCLKCHKEIPMDMLKSHLEHEHGDLKRKHQTKLDEIDLTSAEEGDQSPSPKLEKIEQPEIERLKEMFPDRTVEELETCLELYKDFDRTVNYLLVSNASTSGDTHDNGNRDLDMLDRIFLECSSLPVEERLAKEIKELQKKMGNGKEKLKIDEEDLLEDSMCYYKSEDFDPKKRLRIVYKGQPAVDTGGVMRQFYTQLLDAINQQFFEGLEFRTPIYSSGVLAGGVMKMVGVIIVHSILQGGPGFPVLSNAVYNYICHGNVEETVKSVTAEDCCMNMQHLITQIARASNVNDLDMSVQEEITCALAESGSTLCLTNDNKMKIIQDLIIHDAIGKRKIVLDQLREGLETLGFLQRMTSLPIIFKSLFVADKTIQPDKMKNLFKFPDEMTEEELIISENLKSYVRSGSKEETEDLLIFLTGAPCLPNFGLGKVKVEFSNNTSIYSSTCLMKVEFPRSLTNKESFSAALKAVSKSSGKAFTSV